jgi:predicted MFS family arabinose efflux permease
MNPPLRLGDSRSPAKILLISLACSSVCALPPFLIGALAVQISASLSIDPGRLGLVVSMYFLSSALGSVHLSRVAGNLDALQVMRTGCLLIGVLLGMLALARSSWLPLAAIMTAAGLCNTWTQPAVNQYLADQIPRRRQGVAFGIKQSSVPITTIVGGLAVPGIALTVGWRWAMVAAMIVCALIGVCIPAGRSVQSRVLPRLMHRTDDGPGELLAESLVSLTSGDRARLSMVSVATAFAVGAGSALPVFAVSAAVASGLTPGVAALVAAAGGGAAVLVRVVVGNHVDRRSPTPLTVAAVMLAAGAAGFAILAGASQWEPRILPAVIVVTFAAAWGWNGLLNLAVVQAYPSNAAIATGITGVGGSVGGVVGPLVFGVIAAHASYSAAWWSSAAGAIIGGGIYIIVGRRLPGESAAGRRIGRGAARQMPEGGRG